MGILSLALRNVARNRRRTAMAVLAIGIGVAAQISLRAFISGQQELFLEGLVKGQSGALQVHRTGYMDSVDRLPLTIDMAETPELKSKLLSVAGVRAVAARIVFGAMLSTAPQGDSEEGTTASLLLMGIDPEAEQAVCPQRSRWVDRGQVFRSRDDRELWLNRDLAASVGLPCTERSAPSPEEKWPALLSMTKEGTLGGEAVALTATMKSALPGDRSVGFVPLGIAQRLLGMEGRVTEYAIGVDSLAHVPRIRSQLKVVLGDQYEVHSWDELMPFINDLLSNMELTFGISTGMLLLVALSGVLNAMLTNVLERRREIGTLLAFGMRRRHIALLFVVEGAAMGVLGGVFGALLGSAAVLWMQSRGITIPIPGSDVPAVVIPRLDVGFVLAALVLTALSAAATTLWPAVRASRQRPIEALSAR